MGRFPQGRRSPQGRRREGPPGGEGLRGPERVALLQRFAVPSASPAAAREVPGGAGLRAGVTYPGQLRARTQGAGPAAYLAAGPVPGPCFLTGF